MTIQKENVRNFWAAQAKKSNLGNEGISNLEEDKNLLEKKINLEQEKIMPFIKQHFDENSKVLDLGSGTGQWAFRFSPLVKSVSLVEFSKEMMELAENNSKGKYNNLNFFLSEAQDFLINEFFDLIWISGLLIYLTDSELEKLISNCRKMLSKEGFLILRDGTGLGERYEINNQFSSALGHNYSATYRTANEYIDEFKSGGFDLIEHSDVFEKGNPLNKWKETRLRLYKFS